MEKSTLLTLEHVSKHYAAAGALERVLTLGRAPASGVGALADVSLRVAAGEIVGLLGPNGSGKTTLLRCAAGLLTPTTGAVRTLGADPTDETAAVRGRIGLVMRDDRTFHHRLTGRENLRLFARLQRIPRARRETAIGDAMERAEIAEMGDRAYRTFSAGMRQRLAFARALLGRPELLLLDEATSGLDPGLRVSFRHTLEAMAHDGIGILYATHDLTEVRDLCHRSVLLDEGRVAAAGDWDTVGQAALVTFGIDAL